MNSSLQELCIEAATSGRTSKIRDLLNNTSISINSNIDAYGGSLLIYASMSGHLETVQMLLEQHASVHIVDHNGNSACHKACYHGFVEVALALLRKGSDINLKNRVG